MNCCGPRCGWCGRCDDEPRRDDEPRYLLCDTCGLDAIYPISLSGVGVFCSKPCADAGAQAHEDRMLGRWVRA